MRLPHARPDRFRRAGRPALIAPAVILVVALGSAGAAAAALHDGARAPSAARHAVARRSAAGWHAGSAGLHRAGRPSAQPATARPPQPPAVAPLTRLWVPDLLVSGPATLPPALSTEIGRLPGVGALERVALGAATIAGRPANLMGVDPSGFRGWTPSRTAGSDPLWQRIALGESAVSFDMAQGLHLPLGGMVRFTVTRSQQLRIGAFASVGIAGVDAIVSTAQASALGLVADNALLISAPHADPLVERSAIEALLPAGDHVQVLQQVIVVRDAGEYLTRAQIQQVLHAAASRIGSPYLWGGTGPGAFDCSGLVGWAFAQAGISLPRTAAQQFLAGPHVPYADARPGDLLFWTYDPTDPGFVDHVALYLGNGMMIVAAHTGTVVAYEPVPLADLAGVVRVDPAVAAQVGGPRFP